MANKSDKDIIWETLQLIEDKTMGDTLFVDIRKEDLWKEFSSKEQKYYRALLLSGGLIHMNNDKTWEFRLTAESMVVKRWQFLPNGYKWQFDWGFTKLLIATLSGAIIGALIQTERPKESIKVQLQYPSSPAKNPQPILSPLKNHDTLSLKMIK